LQGETKSAQTYEKSFYQNDSKIGEKKEKVKYDRDLRYRIKTIL